MKNRTCNVRYVAMAVALSVAAGGTSAVMAAGNGAEKGSSLVMSRSPGGTTLSVAGAPVRTTQAAVSNQRLITLANSSTVIALWDETSPTGAVEHWYGLSVDGRTFSVVQPTTYQVRLAYGTFDPMQGEPAIPAGLEAAAGSRVYMVQFVAPPVDEFRRDLTAMGARVERFLTDHTHVVTMDAGTAARVQKLPYVRWVGKYHPAYKLSSEIREELAQGGAEFGAASYSIEVFQRGPAQQQAVADAVAKLGGVFETITSDAFRAQASLTLAQVVAIAKMDEVNYMDPWGPGGTDMDIARQIGGAHPFLSGLGFLGQGVRGEVHDTEVSANHPQWNGQTPLYHATNGNSGTHGSSCYGICFATGTGNAQATGLLPQREQGIFFWYNQTSQFVAGATYTRLMANTEATDPAQQFKSSFQTSSVGSPQITAYSTISAETDDYLFKVDYLSCQSQSNTGNNTSRPQAWAKNIFSVGALNHQNTLTRADDANSGASFGPAADGRTKPDVLSFYDSIFTTTSGSGYTEFGGTSGATPIVAGHCGLMMQMWHEGVFPGFGGGSSVFADRPRSTTAKALICNTSYRYPLTQLTRVRQGWGMPDLQNLYNLRNKMLIVNETELLTNGQNKTYNVNVQPGEPLLAVTMAYKDPQGNPAAAQARINDVSLKVTAPGGAVYWGNNGLQTSNFSSSGGAANTIDTVENVFVQNPEVGAWTIEVVATSVVADGHLATPGNDVAFGLVASGVIPGPPPPLSIALPGGIPQLIAPNTPTDIPVRIIAGTQTVQPGTEQLKYRFSSSGSFLTSPLTHISGENYTATLPGAACGSTPQFYITATGNLGGTVTNPGNAPTGFHSTQIGTVIQSTLMNVDFNGALPAGWSGTGLWHVSTGTTCQPGGTPCAGPQAAYYGQDATCNFATGSTANSGTLTAPVISLPAMPPGGTMKLTYCSALLTEAATNYDKATVLINGTEVDRAAESSDWQSREINLAQFAGQNITIAFKFDTVDGVNNTFRGWHIDNVKVVASSIGCQTACYANCDGSTTAPILNVNDFVCFQTKYAAGDPTANCDGSTTQPVLNVNDFICFQTAYAAGCP